MQSITNFIANHMRQEDEGKSPGAFAAGAFVAVMLIGSAGAAMWIGSALSTSSAQAAPMEIAVDYAYE